MVRWPGDGVVERPARWRRGLGWLGGRAVAAEVALVSSRRPEWHLCWRHDQEVGWQWWRWRRRHWCRPRGKVQGSGGSAKGAGSGRSSSSFPVGTLALGGPPILYREFLS
uniref:Uncharacterized protein n=1 Tax=Oryza nivara TaxID=4536 RepID=A0A0E0HCW2_ORYNI